MKRFIVRHRLILLPLWVLLFLWIISVAQPDAFEVVWELVKQAVPPLLVFSLFMAGVAVMLFSESAEPEDEE